MLEMESDMEKLLSKYSSLKYNEEKTKIICEWSGHEMPLTQQAVMTYVNGNRYKKLLAKVTKTDLNKYNEFLKPSTKSWGGNMYYCLLTLKHVNKQADHVQRHVTGKRFLKSYLYWLECKEKGVKFVPLCKQRYVNDENNSEEEGEDTCDSDTEEMFDMMDMEKDLDTIKNESGDDEPKNSNKKDLKKKKKQSETVDVQNDEDSVVSEEVTEDDSRMEPVKRKLDSKLNKKHKIEPKKKKQTVK